MRSSSSAVVGFCGSRGLRGSVAAGLVSRVVASVVGGGRGVAVGCAVGADSLVLSSCLRAGVVGRVFSVFGFGGSGALSSSAVGSVRAAAAAGWSVVWWAGGGPVRWSVRQRLARRSRRLVRFVAASPAGSGLVAFVARGRSAGSWLSVRAAVRAGLPVVVFPVGWVPLALGGPGGLPRLGRGSWVVAGSGVWALGWRWVPGE